MCFIEINSKDEMSFSWKKQKYVKQWSQFPGKQLTTGYGKGKFTLRVGDAQKLTEHDSALRRGLDQVTSRGSLQHKLFIFLCCFVASPYLSHNLSCLMLKFIIVKCKRKAVLSVCKCFFYSDGEREEAREGEKQEKGRSSAQKLKSLEREMCHCHNKQSK